MSLNWLQNVLHLYPKYNDTIKRKHTVNKSFVSILKFILPKRLVFLYLGHSKFSFFKRRNPIVHVFTVGRWGQHNNFLFLALFPTPNRGRNPCILTSQHHHGQSPGWRSSCLDTFHQQFHLHMGQAMDGKDRYSRC